MGKPAKLAVYQILVLPTKCTFSCETAEFAQVTYAGLHQSSKST